MSIIGLLIPVSLGMGAVGLAAFFWSLRSGQFHDLEGDGRRIFLDGDDAPLRGSGQGGARAGGGGG